MAKEKLYPLELIFKTDVEDVCFQRGRTQYTTDGLNAIEITIKISDGHYKKESIKKELSKAFQTILEYYD